MKPMRRRFMRPLKIDRRTATLVVAGIAVLLLIASVYNLMQFRQQRQEATRNQVLLAGWQEQLLTATPISQEQQRLQQQLEVARARFAEASALLPSVDVEAAVLQRILEAAQRSGVELSNLEQQGDSFQEGALVGWRYEVAAEGEMSRLSEFATRLEQEAFPVGYFTDPVLTKGKEGQYVLAGMLTVYGSTLSTGSVAAAAVPEAGELGARLRLQAEEALAQRDFERALSLLLRAKAQEPASGDIDRVLYETYVAYAQALLDQNHPELADEQIQAALAIEPDGQEAVALLVSVARAGTTTPTGEIVAAVPTPMTGGFQTPVTSGLQTPMTSGFSTPVVPSGVSSIPTPRPPQVYVPPPVSAPPTFGLPPTVAPPPTRAPLATRTPIPPVLIPPTIAPAATLSSSGSVTPSSGSVTPASGSVTPPAGSVTPVASGTPGADSTPSTTATASPVPRSDPNPFGAMTPVYLPNCGLTQIRGTIKESESGAPINGVTVRVWFDGANPDQIYALPSGQEGAKGPGEWEVVLDGGPKAGKWYVAVVERETGELLSQVQTVETDTGPCQPGESGRQVVIQDFLRYGEGPGVAVPVATATPVPSSTPTPLATPSPSVTRVPSATRVSSVTATVTVTPAISPTPTVTPSVYSRDEEPDLTIVDGPDGEVTSTIVVEDDIKIRQASVFLNIDHEDVSDLEVTLVSPTGARIPLRSKGENTGERSIRTTVAITDDALALIKDKSAEGTWVLEVVDAVEGLVGELLSWELRIFP